MSVWRSLLAVVMIACLLLAGGVVKPAFAEGVQKVPGLDQFQTDLNTDANNAGSTMNKDNKISNYVTTKTTEILTIIFSVATIFVIAVGAIKAMKLSSSNARNRSEAISDLMWWAIGGGVCFSAAVITGMIYFFMGPSS